ncbi:MAG TPA: response regulator [Spirochaetia bacterium]|nr:response regulator [Spirochaetia bacterium]
MNSESSDLFEHLPVACFLLDISGTILRVNPVGADLAKTESIQVVAKPFLSLVPQESHVAFLDHIRRAAETRGPEKTRIRIRDRERAERWCELRSMPLEEPGTKCILVTVVIDSPDRNDSTAFSAKSDEVFPAPDESVTPSATGLAGNGPTGDILIVEDNAINVLVLQLILKKAGHRVHVVSNGREAISHLSTTPCDLVLMDIEVPELDGIQTTRVIRDGSTVLDSHLPIIAMTAHSEPGDRERFVAAGMDDYISKPFKTETVLGVISAALLRSQLPDR